MAAWETEDELGGPAIPSLALTTSMPMPVDVRTPSRTSRTPSRGSRRSSRRSVTPPGRISISPPTLPGSDKTDKSDRVVKDFATDHKISILDPRRFTPTLHANLVSEILTLRRDQEEKLKFIEQLESTLQTTREEEDSIQTTLVTTAKENRSLRRQLALLEGGTSSALGELARERDEAVDAATETKKRLEAAQKKLKSQEEDSGRTHDLWAKDKDEWEEERRKMERKLHVAETRLKTILEEVTAFHAAQANGQAGAESDGEDRGNQSDAGSIRSMSMSIRESLRFSLMNMANGHSLADELDLDDDSDYQTDANGRDSVISNYRHARNDSRASVLSKSHRRHHSGESLIRSGSITRGRYQPQKQVEGSMANGVIQEAEEPPSPAPPLSKISYTDTGIQYSPPPSPKLPPTRTSKTEPAGVSALAARWEKHMHHEAETSPEANQSRKRVSVPATKPPSIQPPAPQMLMVSASAQTIDVPPSPPKTPKSPLDEQPPSPKPEPAAAAAVMTSASTQTDPPTPPPPPPATPPSSFSTLAIPSIAIHPPTSRPSSPKESRLPQLHKDFGCQVSIQHVPISSTGVQTDEIRVDQRLDRLPAHLHPSAIQSRPTTPLPESQIPTDPDRNFTPLPGNVPPRNPRRLTSRGSNSELASSPRISRDLETLDASPEYDNDNPPSQKAPVRRPPRVSSLFAGFEVASSGDEMDDFADADMSDHEYRTALSAPRPVKSPDSGLGSAPTSPEEIFLRKGGRNAVKPLGNTETYSSFRIGSRDGPGPSGKAAGKGGFRNAVMGGGKIAGGMRKAAMIQSGIATHQEDGHDPPFPIPARASSRKPLFSGMGGEGNRSPTRNEPWHRRGTRHRTNSLRKSRSATSVSHGKGRKRQGSRSPPRSPEILEADTVPPMPRNDLTTPKNERGRMGHRHQHSTNTATTEATGFQSNASSQGGANGVVDAIAQTMVGEWMFKYVRRRKSFGVADHTPGKDDSSNDRHKRWVWLAPYERAILWSSKQPSSGSALLGKSGRKLTIQSVLDVKDDNPPPKGTSVFNRSILILTPQRALKFTAVNAERHYLWLTSLSFLAHSQQDVPDIPTPVPRRAPDFELTPKEAKTRRPRIRDSIRLAKSHHHNSNDNRLSRPADGIGGHVSPMPSIPDVPLSSVPGYRSPPPPPPGSESVASGYSNSNSSRFNYSNPGPGHAHQRSDFSAAEPPQVLRFQDRDRAAAPAPAVHGRKRSNTGSHIPPPLSFRGFSSPTYSHAPTNSQSTGAGASDIYSNSNNNSNNNNNMQGGTSSARSENGTPLGWMSMSNVSGRTSETSNRMSGNFFDAIGTVRMEAFISPLAFSRYESDAPDAPDAPGESHYTARRRSKEIRRRKSRSRQRDSHSSRSGGGRYLRGDRDRDDYHSGHRTAGEEEFMRDDPFKGF